MHDSTIFLLFLCQFWVRCVGIDGLWLLCSYLQSSAVRGHHVASCLFSDDVRFVCDRVFWGHGPHQKHTETDLPWFQHRWPLPVWSPPLLAALLHVSTSMSWCFLLLLAWSSQYPLSVYSSHALILSSILRIPSTEGRSKAFSTCGSQVAVTLFFGSEAFTYLKTSFPGSMDHSKFASVFYTSVVPMLTLWSTVWGIRMLKLLWEKPWRECSSDGSVCISYVPVSVVLKNLFIYRCRNFNLFSLRGAFSLLKTITHPLLILFLRFILGHCMQLSIY